jgi:hypothetical protein
MDCKVYNVALANGDKVQVMAPDKTTALLTAAELWAPQKPVNASLLGDW